MIEDIKMPGLSEEQVHRQIVDYLKYQYHNVMFYTTLDGMKLTKAQAGKAKHFRNPGTGWPDIFVTEPVGRYHGLYLEIKKPGVQLFRATGLTKLLKGDTHVRGAGDWWDLHTEVQATVHDQLRQRGYAVTFVCGFDAAQAAIETYFKGREIATPLPTYPALAGAAKGLGTEVF